MSGAASYNVYRSPLSGGGWVRANDAPVTGMKINHIDGRNWERQYPQGRGDFVA